MAPATPVTSAANKGLVRPLGAAMTDPKDKKTQDVMQRRASKKYLSPGDTKFVKRPNGKGDEAYIKEERSDDDEDDFVTAPTFSGTLNNKGAIKATSNAKTVKRRKTSKDGDYIFNGDSFDSDEDCPAPAINITPRDKITTSKIKDEGYESKSTQPTPRTKIIKTFEDAIASGHSASSQTSPSRQTQSERRKSMKKNKSSLTKPVANYSPAPKKGIKRSVSDVDDDELEAEEAQIQARLQTELKAAEWLESGEYQAILNNNKQMLEEKRQENWHPQEIEVFERLALRGYEPLFHYRWNKDFTTFPHVLFTTNDEETIVNTFSENEFRGIRALESLISLGARVRSNWRLNKPTAKVMKKEIESYIHHTAVDAGYANKDFIPSIIVLTAPFTNRKPLTLEQGAAVEARTTKQMHKLAARHRAALALPKPHHINELGEAEKYRRPPPVVFGIVCSETKVWFASLDSAITDETIAPNAMTAFNFAHVGADVWNGIAIALLCINVRNVTHDFIEELQDKEVVVIDEDA